MSALRRVDFQLLTVVLLLCFIGAIAIYSCTRTAEDSSARLTMQLAYIIVGLAVMFGTMTVDTGKMSGLAWPFFIAVMGLLVVVLMMGSVRETHRWIPIGPVNIQPSELAKLAVIVMLGAAVSRMEADEYDFIYLMKTLAYVAAPSFLIILQPDLGTPIVLFFIWLVMMFTLGASPVHLGAFILAGFLLFAGAWGFGLIKPHQKARLTAFMNPDDASLSASYHLRQSLIAVGAGHLWGQGLFRGAQSQADFIPDQETDFIFTVIAEELGFVGAASVVVLYGLLLYRALCISAAAPTTFDRVVAAGIVGMLLIEVYANIGMTIGLAPVKGMALPFLSYGGSSLMTNMMAVGILQSIHMRREQIVF
jgi:rod shape determining protein RodA